MNVVFVLCSLLNIKLISLFGNSSCSRTDSRLPVFMPYTKLGLHVLTHHQGAPG